MTAAMCSNQQQKEGSGSPRPSPPITTVHVIYVRIIGDTLKINRFLFLSFFFFAIFLLGSLHFHLPFGEPEQWG